MKTYENDCFVEPLKMGPTTQAASNQVDAMTHVVQLRTHKVDNLPSAYDSVAIEVYPVGVPVGAAKPLWRSHASDVTDGLAILDTWARLQVRAHGFEMNIKVRIRL